MVPRTRRETERPLRPRFVNSMYPNLPPEQLQVPAQETPSGRITTGVGRSSEMKHSGCFGRSSRAGRSGSPHRTSVHLRRRNSPSRSSSPSRNVVPAVMSHTLESANHSPRLLVTHSHKGVLRRPQKLPRLIAGQRTLVEVVEHLKVIGDVLGITQHYRPGEQLGDNKPVVIYDERVECRL